MSGPWEKYQTQPDGPWKKYGTVEKRQPTVDPALPQVPDGMVFDPRSQQYVDTKANAEAAGDGMGAITSFLKGHAFGGSWTDEALGQVDEALTGAPSEIMTETARASSDRFAEEHPWLSTGAQLAGGLNSAFGIGRLAAPAISGLNIAKAGSLGGKALAGILGGGLAGATEGAIYGAGLGEEGSRVESAGKEAGVQAVLSALTGGIGGALAGRSQRKAAIDAVPTVDELKQQAGALYDKVAQSGVTIPPSETAAIARRADDLFRSEGLETPVGRVAKAYNKANHARSMLKDYAPSLDNPGGFPMDMNQAKAVRRSLSDAAGSIEKPEARVGSKMIADFDNWISGYAPELEEANALYSRAKKGSMVDEAIELAGVRAGQFSGSGFENALRTEFRGLSRKITKGHPSVRGLTEAQKEAIKTVADGGSVQTAMRNLGKLAPTGVVSAGLGGGGAYAVGNTIGGPAMGAGAAATTMGLGTLGRIAATRMGVGAADTAAAMMRNGGPIQYMDNEGDILRALQAAMLARAARPETATE